eukprot:gene9037-11069_t
MPATNPSIFSIIFLEIVAYSSYPNPPGTYTPPSGGDPLTGYKDPSSSAWKYDSGPEKNQAFYYHDSGQCVSFCPFSITEPNSIDNEVILIANGDVFINSNPLFTTAYVLVEYGGDSDPVIPTPKVEGGSLTITFQSGGWNTSTIVVNVKPKGASENQICTYESATQNSYTCKYPAGYDYADVTITDGTKNYVAYNIKYFLPWVENVYSTLTANSLVTMVGQNFGTDTSKLTIKLGTQSTICSSPTFLLKHYVVTCTLPYTPQLGNPLFPIVVQAFDSYPFNGLRPTFYDSNNFRMIRTFPGPGHYEQLKKDIAAYPQIDGFKPFMGTIYNAAQAELINSVFFVIPQYPHYMLRLIYLTSKTPNGWYYDGDENNGQLAITSDKQCQPGIYCPSNFENGSYVNGTTLSYLTNDSGYNASIHFGLEIIYYGSQPVFPTSTITRQFNTTGGSYSLVVQNNGFSYTKRTVSVYNRPGSVNVDTLTTLIVDIPKGYQQASTTPININIENFSFSSESAVYNPPSVQSCDSAPTAGGTIVIKGFNFFDDASLLQITIGGTPCDNIQMLVPHYSISCRVSPGSGSMNIAVKLGLAQSSDFTFSYNKPNITSVYQVGSTLFVNGTDFGSNLADIKLKIPTDPINPSTSVSDQVTNQISQVSIPIPFGTLSGSISIIVNGLESTPFQFTLIPVLTSISQASTFGGEVVIHGYFLNSVRQDNSPTQVTVIIDNQPCTPITFDTPSQPWTKIRCNVLGGTGKNHPVNVTIDSFSSNIIMYQYNSPIISTIVQTTDSIVITGENFGNSIEKTNIVFTNGNILQPNGFTLGPPSSITAPLPNSSKTGRISVVVDQLPSAYIDFFVTPVIFSINTLPTIGGRIQLSGNFFNIKTENGTLTKIVTQLAGGNCTNLVITNSTYLECDAPPGTGSGKQFALTIDGKTATKSFSYLPPKIYQNLVSQSGTILSINGENFGSDISKVTVLLPASSIALSISAPESPSNLTQIAQFQIPLDTLNSDQISVLVDSQHSNPIKLRLIPQISSTSLVETVGGILHINGTFLGQKHVDSTPTVINVLVGGKQCDNFFFDNIYNPNGFIGCTLPSGSGVKLPTVVTIDEQSNTTLVSYLAPTVSVVYQDKTLLYINGTNLGDPNAIQKSNAWIGTLSMAPNSLTNTNYPPQQMVTSLPIDSQSGDVFIITDGQTSNNLTIQLAPKLVSIGSTSTSGGIVTIGGHFLNDKSQNGTSTSVSIYFTNDPSKQCHTPTKILNNPPLSQMTCLMPAGTGTQLSLTVDIDGLSDTINFSYGAPNITSVSVSDRNYITIYGNNFGEDENKISVQFGNIPITQFLFDAAKDEIEFKAPTNAINQFVSVNVNGAISESKYVSLYPIISSVTQVDTIGGNITVIGNFINAVKQDNLPTNVQMSFSGKPCQKIYMNSTDNTYLICTVGPGTGKNHPIVLTIESRSTQTMTGSYSPPEIQNLVQTQFIMEIIGNNFGNDPKIFFTTAGSIFGNIINITDHSIFIDILPTTSVSNGLFNITIDTLVSNNFNLQLIPLITNVDSISPYGGKLGIKGYFLNEKRINGDNTEISIKIGAIDCTFIQSVVAGQTILCSLLEYSFSNATIQLSIDQKNADTTNLLYNSLGPIISYTSSLYYKYPGLVTITGDNFINPIKMVNIGQTECTSPKLLDAKNVQCSFNSLEVVVNHKALPVIVISANLSAQNNVFLYNENTCPGKPICSGNGDCSLGFCTCKIGFSGFDCSINTTNLVPVIRHPTPDTTGFVINGELNFNASITHIREITNKFKPVKTLYFELITWVLVSNTTGSDGSISTTYKGTFDGESVQIQLISTKWTTARTINFLGEVIPQPKNSIKHFISISGWSFQTDDNLLQLIYKSSTQSIQTVDCLETNATSSFHSSTTDTDLISSMLIDTPTGSMVATFSTRAKTDNYVSFVETSRLKSDDPLINNRKNSQVLETYVSLTVPSFKSSVSLDPTFYAFERVYEGTIGKCQKPDDSDSNRKWVLPVAIVVSVNKSKTTSTTPTTSSSSSPTTTSTNKKLSQKKLLKELYSSGKNKTDSDDHHTGSHEGHPLFSRVIRGMGNGVTSVQFSHDNKFLAISGTDDRTLKVYLVDSLTEKSPTSFNVHLPYDTATALAWGAANTLYAALKDSQKLICFSVFDKKNAEGTFYQVQWSVPLDHKATIKSICASPQVPYLITCGDDTIVKVWSNQKGQHIQTINTGQIRNFMASMSLNGKFFGVASFCSEVKIYEAILKKDGSLNECKRVMSLSGYKSSIHSLSFTSDGLSVVTGGKEGGIKLWSLNVKYNLDVDPECIYSIQTTLGVVDFISISPDSTIFVAGNSESGNLEFYNLKNGNLLPNKIENAQHGSDIITSLTWSPNSKLLLTGGSDKYIN